MLTLRGVDFCDSGRTQLEACPRPWFRGYVDVPAIPWEEFPHDAGGIRLPPVERPNEGSFMFNFGHIKFNRDI